MDTREVPPLPTEPDSKNVDRPLREVLQTPVTESKKRKFESLTPEEQSTFQDMFVSCLRRAEVVQIFKDIITECFKDERIKQLEEKVHSLERRLEESEQYSRRTCLKITGIPESENENTDEVVMDVAKTIKVDLKPTDISRSHRLPTRNKKKVTRDIVVRFVTYNNRKKFIDARRNLKDKRGYDKVYINEHLTQQRQELAWTCRKYVKEKQLLGTWTRDGRVAIKLAAENGEEMVKWVTHIDDLNRIIRPAARADLDASFLNLF